jgi:DnaK suppressor protein
VTKPQAKAADAGKTAAKGSKPTTPPPAAKSAAKGAAKPVGKPVPMPAPKALEKPAAKAAAAPAPAKAATSKPAVKPAAAGSAAAAVAPASPASNRFTDRFAPARQPKGVDPIEVQKSSYKADPKLVNAWKTKAGRDLTEPELLAMPDGEYMNEKQVDFFRALLRAQRDDLLSNAGETTEHLREDTTIVPDPADRATIEEEHALELRTRDRERKLLKKISQSLTRLDSNEYGYCDETGEPIGLARLRARPTATLSLEAQQRRELKQKMFGD